ncbi:hypothetical protein B6264_16570 [Kitasatospora aureofaciens]|nr:hypothetical protein B6264_10020 [Kitasatospora aureofaciens]ARF80307.1 hypothetical protein B6264_16570 [Kitasatospora aureofaciens]QEU99716.1 hypothetical protein CP971_10830 [Streptomyces viridifaciens]QEV00406.1 hypothetical protein CP971_14980 [Streptomyces viridifaciens]
MSTYLALTFGTLLSSQGTDASFRPPSSGPSGRFVLSCFQLIRCFPLRFRRFVIQLAGVFCGLTPRPTFQTLADPRSEKRIQPSPTAIR